MLPAKTARTRSVGTKLSEEEYARLEALAAQRGLTVGEWVREVVLKAGEPSLPAPPSRARWPVEPVLVKSRRFGPEVHGPDMGWRVIAVLVQTYGI